jgi:hypothetical protein
MGQRYCVPQASKAGQRKQRETGIVPNNNHAIRLVFGKDATFVEQKSYSSSFWALWVTGRSRSHSSFLTPLLHHSYDPDYQQDPAQTLA